MLVPQKYLKPTILSLKYFNLLIESLIRKDFSKTEAILCKAKETEIVVSNCIEEAPGFFFTVKESVDSVDIDTNYKGLIRYKDKFDKLSYFFINSNLLSSLHLFVHEKEVYVVRTISDEGYSDPRFIELAEAFNNDEAQVYLFEKEYNVKELCRDW